MQKRKKAKRKKYATVDGKYSNLLDYALFFKKHMIQLRKRIKRLITMTTAEILRQERERRNLTQNDIANYIHIGRAAYSMYEIGKNIPPTEIICRLADLYNVTTDYLLARTENRETPTKRARIRKKPQNAPE